MIDQLISAILQLGIFTLIPYIAYYFFYRNKTGFLNYIGIKKAPWKPVLIALAISLFNILPFYLDISLFKPIVELMRDPASITGKLNEMGPGTNTLAIIVIIAFIKTALAEEILFRGFIAKRLIALIGFTWGNILQAIIFGAIHLLLFLTLSENPVALAYVFFLPGLIAILAVWLNEKMADGSIWPGWVAHGFGNFFTYTYFSFS
jgi:membrane protease YdiL (CAAX protease family)